MLQKLKILVLNGLADIVNFYIQLPFRIASGLATLGSTIWSTFSKALGTVKTNVVNFFKGAGSWLLDAGKNIITGIIGGITSMGGWFMSQVSKFVSDHLPGFVKKILGIGSPSKVFMEIGKNTMVGLQMGIQSQATSVSSTMNAVMGNVLRSSVMQPTAAAAAGAGVGGGRVVNLFPGATVGMREPADADTIVKRLEALVGGSRL
jgi:hypothetical protein